MESQSENLTETHFVSDGNTKEGNEQSASQTQDLEAEANGHVCIEDGSMKMEAHESFTERNTGSSTEDAEREIARLQGELESAKTDAERQAADYECKLNSDKEKIKNLESRLSLVQESAAVQVKETDEKLLSVEDELQKVKVDLELAAADQLKLKSVETESRQLAEELHSCTTKVSELEEKLEMSKEQVQQLACDSELKSEQLSSLKQLLASAEAKAKEFEDGIISKMEAHHVEIEAMELRGRSLEEAKEQVEVELETLKVRAQDLENELKSVVEKLEASGLREKSLEEAKEQAEVEREIFKVRAQDLETELKSVVQKMEDHRKQALLQEELAKESIDRSTELQNMLTMAESKRKDTEETINSLQSEMDEMRVQISALLESEKILNETEAQRSKLELDLSKFQETYVNLEMKLRSAEDMVEEHKSGLNLHDQNAVKFRERISELEKMLDSSDSKCKSSEEFIDILQVELNEHKSSLNLHDQNAVEFRERISELEKMLDASDSKCKSSEEFIDILQVELNELKLTGETTTAILKETEGKLTQLESELQEKLRASEERCQHLERSIHELTEECENLKKDASIAAAKTRELELDMEILQNTKAEIEEKFKMAEEQSADHKNRAQHSLDRSIELESLIEKHHTEADDTAKKIIELEAAVANVQGMNNELQMLHKNTEDKSFLQENTIRQLSDKASELEEALKGYETQVNHSQAKVADLELALTTSRQKEQELEERLRSAEEISLQQEISAKNSAERVTELQELVAAREAEVKIFKNKIEDLELALENTRQRVSILEEKLRDAEGLLSLQENMAKEATTRCEELEGALLAANDKIKDATDRAASMEVLMHTEQQLHVQAMAESKDLSQKLSLLQEEFTKVEALAVETAARLAQEETKVSELEPYIEKLKETEALISILKEKVTAAEERASAAEADLHSSVLIETKLREELSTEKTLISTLQASMSQVENEKHAFSAQIDRATSSLNQLNEQLTNERQHFQQQLVTIMQENNALTEKNASLQRNLQEALADTEVSSKQLQESSSREATFHDELKNLKFQLNKAEEERAHVVEMEQQLQEAAVTREEHQEQIEHLMLTTKSLESKLTEAEQEKVKWNAETEKLKSSIHSQDNIIIESQKAAQKSVDGSHGDNTRRDLDRELAPSSLGNIRRRKGTGTRGVDETYPTEIADGKTEYLPHSPLGTRFLFVLSIVSLVSLLAGFGIARKVGF